MSRTTIKDLESTVNSLVGRLDNASDFCKQLSARIVELEEQAVKTRKQLWYLQKRAKGEFGPQAPKNGSETATQRHANSEPTQKEMSDQGF